MANTIEEPLRQSAPIALRMAPALCHRDPASGESCAWNHGPWQFLRLAGLAMTPALHAEFYREAVHAVTRRGSRPRVLISAAADYSMYAHALAALRELDAEPEVTVVDLCETPLMLSRWYADHAGHRVRTVRCGILEFSDERPYDLVCTHSFLGRFDREARVRLLAHWHALLRPGGAVITVNRVQDAGQRRFTVQQAQTLRDTVLAAAQALRPPLEYDAAELARLVEAYASQPSGIPLRSRAEFLEPFERAGFALQQVSWGPITAGARRDLSGPRVPGDSEYGRVIALRR